MQRCQGKKTVIHLSKLGNPRMYDGSRAKRTGYIGLVDATLPSAMENVVSNKISVTQEGFSEEDLARDLKFYDVLLATSDGEALDELLNLPRICGLEWWRRTSLRHCSKTTGHAERDSGIFMILRSIGGFPLL